MLDFKEFLGNMETFLGKELLEHRSYSNMEMLRISRARITPLAQFLLRSNAVLRGIYGNDHGKSYNLNYLFTMDNFRAGLNILVQTSVDKLASINSISTEYHLAESLEMEVINRLGVEFTVPKVLEKTSYLCAPFRLAVESSKDNLFPYGIFDNIHRYNYYFEFNFENNIIKDVELKNGWTYRGIQEILSDRDIYTQENPIISRIAGLMAVHHQIAYYTGIESMLSLKINNKVSLIRTMLAEIERIENHVIWFGNLMNLLSSDLDYVELVRLWKEFSKIIKILNNGKPHLADTLSLGSSIEVSNETASRALRIAKQVIPMIFDMLYKYSYSSFVEEKCKGVGIITQAQGYKEGFTGPVLRSTGNGIDVRHTTPYLSYTSGEISQLWDVVSFTDSDIFARVQVRLWEIKNSYSVIEYILKSLENYVRGVEAAKINEDKKYLPKNEMSISKVESPHGELQYYFKTNPEKELKVMDAVRIITPDMLNFYAMKNAGLIGNKLSHVPNIIHSMDFFFENIDL